MDGLLSLAEACGRSPQAEAGGQGRNRTSDTVIFSHVLYQLSYLALMRSVRGRTEFGV